MTNEQMSALVQDVLDGKESAIKGFAILKKISDHVTACLDQVKKTRYKKLITMKNHSHCMALSLKNEVVAGTMISPKSRRGTTKKKS